MDKRSKKDRPISPADKLVTTGKKGDIQLSEEDLSGVSGGFLKIDDANASFLKIDDANANFLKIKSANTEFLKIKSSS